MLSSIDIAWTDADSVFVYSLMHRFQRCKAVLRCSSLDIASTESGVAHPVSSNASTAVIAMMASGFVNPLVSAEIALEAPAWLKQSERLSGMLVRVCTVKLAAVCKFPVTF